MSELLESLNSQQQAAVTHPGGPAIVLAGAGSGKTRVLTTRVAWLLKDQHLNPEEIVLVTFTNKAAQEMNSRVQHQAGSQLPLSGTFHRLSALLLRRHGQRIGLEPQFLIFDSDDQLTLLKQIYKEYGFNTKQVHPQAAKSEISNAKNKFLSWSEYSDLAKNDFQATVARIYKLYQHRLSEQHAVDFDDLLNKTVELLTDHDQIRSRYQAQIQHVLVDEYQDTNRAQYLLTKLLGGHSQHIFVVGDFAQSIYAWRGADYRNLLNLKKDFSPVTEYKLEQNYRSTQTILTAATQVMSHTDEYPVLQLWTDNQTHHTLPVMAAETGEEEAWQVVREIQQLSREYNLSDMAILYRTNAQSRSFEEVLVRQGINYRVVGGYKFYERKEVKDVLAYLRILMNPLDSVSAERIAKLGKRRLQQFQNWATAIDKTQPPLELLQGILDATKYLELFDPHDPDDVSRLENVQELLNVAGQFTDTHTLLENVALVQDDSLADVEATSPKQVLTLMSLHSAKGLEFPVVFLVGMEDGLLPHSRTLMDKKELEEERRLLYVGITRAKEKLYFSYARKRWIYGTPTYSLRSRFLQDIATDLLDERASSTSPPQPAKSPLDRWRDPSVTKTSQSGRKLIIDDSMVEGVLSGDIDIKKFLES